MLNKAKFKVLLIHANSTLDTLIPPNLAVIAAILKEADNEVKLFDTTFYKTRDSTGDDARVRTLQVKETDFRKLGIFLEETDMDDDFMKMIEEYKPDLIGLSAVSLTYPFGIKFFKRLRQEGYKIPTIVGGIHPTISSEEVLKEDCVDYVCRGEGEYALLELCEALRDGKDTTNIKNIWAKAGGKIYKNEMREPADINKIPFQDWSMFDERRINKPMGGKIRRVGCFELDRGCPYSCTYCCNLFWNKMYNYKNYRQRNVKRFIDEVEYMKEKYKLEFIYLASETFLAAKKERFMEFVKLWKERINLPLWAETRPETVSEEKIRMFKEIGLHSMNIGVESGSFEIRKMLHRFMTNEQIINAFNILNKFGIRNGVNNIIGFPDETREQIFETVELNRKINPTSIMTHVFNPYRGTPLYDLCIKKGYIPKTEIGGDYRQDFVLKMPQITKEEILGLQRTFALYVKMPKERWPEIKRAEKFDDEGNTTFQKLREEYTRDFLS